LKKYIIFLIILSVSSIGSALTSFSLAIHVLDSEKSTIYYSLIVFCSFAPEVILNPILGSLIDRWDAKRTILTGFALEVSFIGLLLLLYLNGTLLYWHIMLTVFLCSITNGLIMQAYYVGTGALVGKGELRKAKSMEQIGFGIIKIIAPFLAPLLYKLAGLGSILAVDIISYLCAITALLLFILPSRKIAIKEKVNPVGDMKIVRGYLKKDPGLLKILNYYFISNLLFGLASILLAPLILDFSDEFSLGIVMLCGGLGALCAGFWMSSKKTDSNPVARFINSNIIIGTVLCMSAFLYVNTVVLCAAIFIIIGLTTMNNIHINTFWHTIVPDSLHGRVLGYRTVVMGGAVLVAYLSAGIFLDTIFVPVLTLKSLGHFSELPLVSKSILTMFACVGLLNIGFSIYFKRSRSIISLDILYLEHKEKEL
jgi:DHA3 family macrolide efflux protein-like MFS transporter